MTDEEFAKEKKRLENGRQAAAKCRQKKIDTINRLENVSFLLEKN